jgi:isocitrate/isopropylmalate dehydrogenase
MLDHLGLSVAAQRMDAAIAGVLAEEKVRTPDLGGTSSTSEVAAAVLARV